MAVLFIRRIWPDGYGERLLLASILRRAAYDVVLYKGVTNIKLRRIWDDAYRWLMSDSTDHFTSFINVCDLLNQDPQYIRYRTMRLTKKDVRKFDMVDAHGRV